MTAIEKVKEIHAAFDEAALLLAFEAGKWVGQVELEEHFDNDQYAQAALESLAARKTAMPLHEESTGRTVTVNLRSDEWRRGVRKSACKYMETAKAWLREFQDAYV
jgi:hypothetical protein